MIKHINHQNLLTTPFVAVKQWELFSVQNDDVVLIEPPDSLPEFAVALDYVDYNNGVPIINRDCDIALEQQDSDVISYQEGATGSGIFYPDSEPKNSDGTYKRMVHVQTKAAFYNLRRNPTQIFGVEYIDFPLGKTDRELSDVFRLFSIPRHFFGDKLVESSIHFYDTSLDDNVEIHDDGYQNLLAGSNLFSKIQEVRGFNSPEAFTNIIMPGTASCDCPTYNGTVFTASAHATSSVNVGFLSGRLELPPPTGSESSRELRVSFLFGSITDYFMTDEIRASTVSFGPSGSTHIGAVETSITESFGENWVTFGPTGSMQSLVYEVSGSDLNQAEMSVTFPDTGSGLNNIVLPTSGSEAIQDLSVGFGSGFIAT